MEKQLSTMTIVDAHSHLWRKQDTTWNGLQIKSLKNGRAIFLGNEVQMMSPFFTDGFNSAEIFLSNMDYAQVAAAVVVQEMIDGIQNDYLKEVHDKYPNRFVTCGMCDFFNPRFLDDAAQLIEQGFKGIAIPGHRLLTDHQRVMLNSDEMMRMFGLMEKNDVFLSVTLADGDLQVGELKEVIMSFFQKKVSSTSVFSKTFSPCQIPSTDSAWSPSVNGTGIPPMG
jgi:predicted TIM-barrel fold metal-dependent hydrolase